MKSEADIAKAGIMYTEIADRQEREIMMSPIKTAIHRTIIEMFDWLSGDHDPENTTAEMLDTLVAAHKRAERRSAEVN